MAGHVTLVNADQTHAHEPFGMRPIHMSWAIRGMDPAEPKQNETEKKKKRPISKLWIS